LSEGRTTARRVRPSFDRLRTQVALADSFSSNVGIALG
jgi:hypothetical protein